MNGAGTKVFLVWLLILSIPKRTLTGRKEKECCAMLYATQCCTAALLMSRLFFGSQPHTWPSDIRVCTYGGLEGTSDEEISINGSDRSHRRCDLTPLRGLRRTAQYYWEKSPHYARK